MQAIPWGICFKLGLYTGSQILRVPVHIVFDMYQTIYNYENHRSKVASRLDNTVANGSSSMQNLKIDQKVHYGVSMVPIPCNSVGDASLFFPAIS